MKGQPTRIAYEQAGAYFANIFSSKKGFFIGRIGGGDWDLATYYFYRKFVLQDGNSSNIPDDPIFNELLDHTRKFNGYYDLNNDPRNHMRFARELLRIYRCFDFATVGNERLLSALGYLNAGDYAHCEVSESNILLYRRMIDEIVACDLTNYSYIEDLRGFLCEVFPLLESKKVLVCSPFVDSFTQQLVRRDLLFVNHSGAGFKYPEFELVTLRTPVTYEGAQNYPHGNWFETAMELCAQINRLDFEIALLGCGSYALPLGEFIRSIGKGAIYIGGALQLFFGVSGKRYYQQPYYRDFINDAWTLPLETAAGHYADSKYNLGTEGWNAYW